MKSGLQAHYTEAVQRREVGKLAVKIERKAQKTEKEIALTQTSKSSRDTYGVTPGGERFKVPETHDMVTSLFGWQTKKSPTDLATVVILSCYIILFWALPKTWRVTVFLGLFAVWRIAYNGGIGWLLNEQSKNRTLTKWAGKSKLFEKSSWWVHRFVRWDLEAKLGHDYDFYKAPLEYNTWLVFRVIVDLTLMSDFTCYMMLVFSCYEPSDQPLLLIVSRWTAGTILFFFNLWVKLDAHRVVKDYAWYWGDFFFLEDLELTFDGVFEMAPHPMYSIGYAGYYGFCLMTASYTLFLTSVAAHSAQFLFLILVENPHIDKTYNPEGSKKLRRLSFNVANEFEIALRPPLLIFQNFTFSRMSDVLLLVLSLNTALLAFTPVDSAFWSMTIFFIALTWRIFHVAGLGYLLDQQSKNKLLTRMFLKFGRSAGQAYEEWQAIYNISTVMSYVSLAVYAWRQSGARADVSYWPFWCIVGGMLIALQAWTSYSIYQSLGDYGWFFGDFFYLRNSHSLTFSGIYRYLNNPERLFGVAGVWGLAVITGSLGVGFMAFIWTFGGMAFIRFVEQPHMQKLYGDQMKHEAGIVKTLRHAAASKFPSPVETRAKQLQGSIDRVVSETSNSVEKFLSQARPRLQDARVLLKEYPARLTIVNVSEDLNVNPALYDVKVVHTGEAAKFEIGTPIEVQWNADPRHSHKDWIGIYRTIDNRSTEVTRISSSGKWSAIHKDGFQDHNDCIIDISSDGTSGVLSFDASILPWNTGVYELRYHHDGKHNVLAISEPFEIIATPPDVEEQNAEKVAEALIPIIHRCLGKNSAPKHASALEEWQLEADEDALNRLVRCMKEYYGVDLAPSVVLTDKTPLALAHRLIAVQQALAPLVRTTTG